MSQLPLALDASPPASTRLLTWPRIRLWIAVTLLWAAFRTLSSETPLTVWLFRCGLVAALGVIVFAAFDRWPGGLPPWLPRWILQLIGVLLVTPPTAYLSYAATLGTMDVRGLGAEYWNGWLVMTFMGTLLGPWIALGALLRRSEARVREQSLTFQLQRSELERTALDARLRLLQAQVGPHFLFNTLAHVRSLLRKSGSQDATALLDSLIAYLRAAVPRLNPAQATFAHERQLVVSYLELMRLRIPDRLSYSIAFDDMALAMHCPPMIVLTLVENAVKHGIDPSEAGGHIDVRVQVHGERLNVCVFDTGIGLRAGHTGDGTGLANVRERLALACGGNTRLELKPNSPLGVIAEIEMPVLAGSPT